MPLLRSADYLLRPFIATDAAAFVAAVRESVGTLDRWMPWAHAAYTEDDALAWFALCDRSRAEGTGHEFGIFRSGRDGDGEAFIGGAGLNQFNALHGFCNLGYWVRASAQRQGAALAATGALARFAFGELALSRVEIVVAEGNEPSLAVARKAGAVHECLARNRLKLRDRPVAAHVFSLIAPPGSSIG